MYDIRGLDSSGVFGCWNWISSRSVRFHIPRNRITKLFLIWAILGLFAAPTISDLTVANVLFLTAVIGVIVNVILLRKK